MARIRTIKPEFFTSENIVAMSAMARLLYIALWCEADREGRFEWKPKTFKMRYLPADDCNIDSLCQELLREKVVILYGDGLAYIPQFSKHQHVNPREAATNLPEPTEELTRAPRVSTRESAVTDAQVGREGKGKEGEGKEIRVTAPISPETIPDKKPKARALPNDFAISDAVKTWATESGFSMLAERFEHFIGYAKANGKTYTDWDQAFINSIRGDWAKLNGRSYQRAAVSNNDNWVPPEMRAPTERLIEAERV